MNNYQPVENISNTGPTYNLKDPNETDWFEFESRMRIVIRDLVKPTIDKMNLVIEQIGEVHSLVQSYIDRIDQVEFIVHKSDKKPTRYEEIEELILAVEANSDIKINNLNRRLDNTQTIISVFDSRISSTTEQAMHSQIAINSLTTICEDNTKQISNNKKELFNYANEIYKETKIELTNFGTEFEKVRDTVNESFQTVHENITRIEYHDNLIKNLTNSIINSEKRIIDLQQSKVDVELYTTNYQETCNRLRLLDFSFKSLRNIQSNTDEFIDTVQPIKTYFQISQLLHALFNKDIPIRMTLIDLDRVFYNKAKNEQTYLDVKYDYDFNYTFMNETDSLSDAEITMVENNLKTLEKDKIGIIWQERNKFMEAWNNLRVSNDELYRQVTEQQELAQMEEMKKLRDNSEIHSIKKISKRTSVLPTEKSPLKTGVINDREESSPSKPGSGAMGILGEMLKENKDEVKAVLDEFERRLLSYDTYITELIMVPEEKIMKLENRFKVSMKEINCKYDNISNKERENRNKFPKLESKIDEIDFKIKTILECMNKQIYIALSEENDRQSMGLYGITENLKGEDLKRNFKLNQYMMNTMNTEKCENPKRKVVASSILMNELPALQRATTRDSATARTRYATPINVNQSNNNHVSFIRLSNGKTNSANHYDKDQILAHHPNQPMQEFNGLPIQLKDDCLNCNGGKGLVLQSFKLACLNYKSRKILYNENYYDKIALLDQIKEELKRILENNRSNN